jgi:hypothetical protein
VVMWVTVGASWQQHSTDRQDKTASQETASPRRRSSEHAACENQGALCHLNPFAATPRHPRHHTVALKQPWHKKG